MVPSPESFSPQPVACNSATIAYDLRGSGRGCRLQVGKYGEREGSPIRKPRRSHSPCWVQTLQLLWLWGYLETHHDDNSILIRRGFLFRYWHLAQGPRLHLKVFSRCNTQPHQRRPCKGKSHEITCILLTSTWRQGFHSTYMSYLSQPLGSVSKLDYKIGKKTSQSSDLLSHKNRKTYKRSQSKNSLQCQEKREEQAARVQQPVRS